MSNTQYISSILDKSFELQVGNLNQDDLINHMMSIVLDDYDNSYTVVSIVGGAASGKSSLSHALSSAITNKKISNEILCTDDYVVGDREYRQETLHGEKASKKYDFALMDNHIERIKNLPKDETITVPTLDPETGIAIEFGDTDFTRTVKKPKILIIEGDFPRNNYNIRFFVHVPDAQRLELNLDREQPKDHGKLISQFNERQRTIHKPHTIQAVKNTNYVIDVDVTDTNNWKYDLFKKQES